MKWLNGYKKLILAGILIAIVLSGGSAEADFTFGEPTNMGPMINTPDWDTDPCVSTDNLGLYYASDQPGGAGGDDLYVTTRPMVSDPWGEPVNLGQTVNSSAHDAGPSISTDGLTLYFESERSGGRGGYDIWMTMRMTKDDPWEEAVNLGPTINSPYDDTVPSISNDGLTLYFSSRRAGGSGSRDIWMSTRHTTQDEWGIPVNLGPIVNSTRMDAHPDVCCNNCVLFFSSNRWVNWDICMTRRKSVEEDWGEPVRLDSPLNYTHDYGSSISFDGSTIYWISYEKSGGFGGADIWQASILPVVDLNGDGIVDAADMCIMVDHWGEDYSLCDIGPMPWGDGVVNVEDMKVLAKHLFEDYRLIAHWELNETEGSIAYDSIKSNNGTCHGEPLWVPTGGKIGGALQFDGVDDYVSVPFILNPSVGSFSVFTWLKGGTPGQAILSQANSTSGSNSTWLGIDPSDGKLITKLMHPPFPSLESDSVITDSQWHHVGLVYNRDSLQRHLYVDGTEVAKDISPVAALGSDGGLYIGASKDLEAGSFFSGLIDDVRIYNNVLSAEEIATLIQ